MRNEVFVLLYHTYYIIQICLNPIKSSLLSSRMGNNNRTAKCTVIFATLAIQGPNPNHRVRESQIKANGIELPGKDRGDTHQTDVRLDAQADMIGGRRGGKVDGVCSFMVVVWEARF